MSKIPRAPRELPAEKKYPAVCVGFVDLGTQPANNPEWNDARKCDVVFELVGTKMKATGKPFIVSKRMTYSAGKNSNMAKMLKSWLGVKTAATYEMSDMLGKAADITIEHNDDKSYANVTDVRPGKGKAGKTVTKHYALFLDSNFDKDVFNSLTDGLKEKISSSDEYEAVMLGGGKKKAAKKK